MEFRDTVSKRRSIRAYKDTPVPEDILGRVLEAIRLAPSGRNEQAWKFVVVKDGAKRQQLMQAANNQRHVGQAPVIIAAVALDPIRMMMCEVPAYAVNLAIAMEHAALAAADAGLGTCWIGAFSQDKAREILGIPDKYTIVALMPLGYPAEEPAARARKSLQELICYDTFKE
jgi:nitroreductase